MKPRTIAVALFFALPLGLLGPELQSARAQAESAVAPVTVFVTRHAETAADTNSSRDPELSESGRKRAEALARLLSESGATHLYSSGLKRTSATIAPLAERLELEVTVIPPDQLPTQVSALEGLAPGSVAVVAGHSNTVPGIVQALGGSVKNLEEHPRYGGMLHHDEFDRLFVVTLGVGDGQATSAIELRYGE